MIISKTVDFSFGLPKPKQIPGKIPTVSRMMALALYYDRLIREGTIESVSDIGRLEGVSQQRVSQVMSLLWLSPRLQERILTHPRQFTPAKFITAEKAIQIAKEIDFEKQERLFKEQCNLDRQ